MTDLDITLLLRAADGFDLDSNLRANAADEIDRLRERVALLEGKRMPRWIDGHPCPSCGASPQHWEYHYPRGDSEKDAEINRLRDALQFIADNWTNTNVDVAAFYWKARAALKGDK
jgi:hypothetical protein